MSKLRLGLLLALIFLAVLVSQAPARLLGLVIPSQMVMLDGLSGSVWRGSAARCVLNTGRGYVHLGRVNWTLSPLSLLLFSPTIDFDSRWGAQSIRGELTGRSDTSFDAKEVEATVSAQLLRQFAPVMVEGVFSLQLEEFQLRDNLPHAATGRLVWQNAAWRSPRGNRPLGSYALDFRQAAGEVLRGEILTLSGPLEASGSVELEGRNYRLDALLQSSGGIDEVLQQGLSLMGQPEGEGYRVELSGGF